MDKSAQEWVEYRGKTKAWSGRINGRLGRFWRNVKKEEKTCKKQLTNGTGSDNISKRFEQGTCSQAKARWETEYSS
jgi:hypothetical protein